MQLKNGLFVMDDFSNDEPENPWNFPPSPGSLDYILEESQQPYNAWFYMPTSVHGDNTMSRFLDLLFRRHRD